MIRLQISLLVKAGVHLNKQRQRLGDEG